MIRKQKEQLNNAGKARTSSIRNAGFTIVELLVVIGMIGVMSLIVVVQFGAGNEGFALGNAEALIKTDIRGAQTWAQGGRTCCGDQVPYGYGVLFTVGSSSYDLYAEFDGDEQYQAIGSDQIIDTIDLDNENAADVNITGCTPLNGLGNKCDVYFSVPSADVVATGDDTADLEVTLTHSGTGEIVTLTVNNSTGQVN